MNQAAHLQWQNMPMNQLANLSIKAGWQLKEFFGK
jgi:hypothetical protein